MSSTDSPSTAESFDARTRRALTECMTVLEDGPDLYTVVSESGKEYNVDLREKRCTCLDHKHREVSCKHIRRAAFASGAKPIPAGLNDSVDPLLGDQIDDSPQVPATDGGVAVDVSGESDNEECEDCAELADGWSCSECYIMGNGSIPE
ncbi:hypothetical protein ACFR9U_16145 [Halorientalis brevis]|uniref:SWIM-type domain-containing protein n=1 Tax=Halorientalis brevis TaxID=1126241 RepID=A0ABD6CE20_9EURY|nr:hypothetical protein [Halorientalis brevis]